MSNPDLTPALVAQANDLHAEFLELGKSTQDQLMDWVNKGREVGLVLASLKSSVRHWEQLALPLSGETPADGPRLSFGEAQGRIFLRILDKLPEPAATPVDAIATMKEVSIAQGFLELPCGHGPQKRHLHDPVSLFVRQAAGLQAIWNRDLKTQLQGLNPERRQFLRQQLSFAHEIESVLDQLDAAA